MASKLRVQSTLCGSWSWESRRPLRLPFFLFPFPFGGLGNARFAFFGSRRFVSQGCRSWVA